MSYTTIYDNGYDTAVKSNYILKNYYNVQYGYVSIVYDPN